MFSLSTVYLGVFTLGYLSLCDVCVLSESMLYSCSLVSLLGSFLVVPAMFQFFIFITVVFVCNVHTPSV